MANHQGRSQQPPPQTKPPELTPDPSLPEVKWISLVQTPAGWQVALLRTRGNVITGGPEPYGVPEREKFHGEQRLRIGVANEIMGLVPGGGR
jgi:hypothetical protein